MGYMNPFSYKGRIGRRTFLFGVILIGVLSGVFEILILASWLAFIQAALQSTNSLMPTQFLSATNPILFGILGFAFVAAFIPMLLGFSYIVRRFHDLGKSGKWWFAMLIPVYNIHLAIGLLIERGTLGSNKYGEDPLPPGTPADDSVHQLSHKGWFRVVALLVVVLFGLVSGAGKKNRREASENNLINYIVNTTGTSSGQTIPYNPPSPTQIESAVQNAASPADFPVGGETFAVGSVISVRWNPEKFTTQKVGLIVRSQVMSTLAPADSGVEAMSTQNSGLADLRITDLSSGTYYLRIVCDPTVACASHDSGMFVIVAK